MYLVDFADGKHLAFGMLTLEERELKITKKTLKINSSFLMM